MYVLPNDIYYIGREDNSKQGIFGVRALIFFVCIWDGWVAGLGQT